MGNIGIPKEVIMVPTPIKAPVFPIKAPVPMPVLVPERELVPVRSK